MKFTLNNKDVSVNQIFFYSVKGSSRKITSSKDLAAEIKEDLQMQLDEESLNAKSGEMVFYRRKEGHVLCVALDSGKQSAEDIRGLAGNIYKKLKSERLIGITVSVDDLGHRDKAEALQAMVEGFLMSSYTFDTFKKKPEKEAPELIIDFLSKSNNASMKKALEEGVIMGEGVNFTRWLGDCPGNFMTPTQLAEEAKNAAKGTKMKVTAWDKAKIAKENMDSLIGVSNGSDQEPRFIIMEYKGGPASQKPVCFVGKGLTFDAGGISIKPSAGMEEMKYDMCGGSAVIGTMATIAKLKLKVNVIAYVPASENMPGPSANKPGDIRKARNGKSIEINNTDAEGRLILADALSYASEKKPAWIVDTATLTGSMMIALGNTHTGFFARDNKMTSKIEKAAKKSGEEVWPMPLCEHHSNDMKGTYADLTNTAPSRNAGSATAAAFLENFVEKEIPWAHFDIAGTAWHVGHRLSYAPGKGASGVMVRTFVQMARDHK